MLDEKRKNLKDTYYNLSYYRYVETGRTFPRKRTKKNSDDKFDVQIYQVPELEKRAFSEDEVRNFSLDTYGKHIPYVDGELTILNNYLFDYWGFFLKAEGLALYGHLKRHAYGKKDWCCPGLDLISYKMDKSLNTVRNYLDILERYGFIYKFNVINHDRENLEETPLYKIRKKVPLLTEKLLMGDPTIVIDDSLKPHIKEALKKEQKGLPKPLRSDHDEYVAKMIASAEEVNMMESLSYEEIYSELLKRSKVIKNETMEREITKSKSIQEDDSKINRNLKEQDIMIWQGVMNHIKEKISKPSYETWFLSTYCIKEDRNYYIFTSNEFQQDWMRTRYNELIRESISLLDENFDEIEYCIIK